MNYTVVRFKYLFAYNLYNNCLHYFTRFSGILCAATFATPERCQYGTSQPLKLRRGDGLVAQRSARSVCRSFPPPGFRFVVCHPSFGTMRLVANRCAVTVSRHYFVIFLLRASELSCSKMVFAIVVSAIQANRRFTTLPVVRSLFCFGFSPFYATPTRD